MSMEFFVDGITVYEKNTLNQNPIAVGTSVQAYKCSGKDWQLVIDISCQQSIHHQSAAINLSTILCVEVVKLTNVVALQLEFDGYQGGLFEGAMDIDDEEGKRFHVDAGQLIPVLIIRAITADGSAYSPTRESFVFKMTKNGKIHRVQPILHKIEDHGLDAIHLSDFTVAGEYIVRVNYVEKREQLLSKLPRELQSLAREVTVVVTPSQPKRVQLHSSSVLNHRILQTSNEVDRSFGKNIKFIVLDDYDNELHDLTDLQLTCTITSCSQGSWSSAAAVTVFPSFESTGIGQQAAIVAAVVSNTFLLTSLTITDGAEEEVSAVPDDEYTLQFCLAKTNNPFISLYHLSEIFTFRSSLTMSNEHARIAEEAESARIALEKHTANITEINRLVGLLNVMSNAAEVNREFQVVIRSTLHGMPRSSDLFDSFTAKLIQRKNEMECQPHRRAIISRNLQPCPDEALGYLVNLATVGNETVARIISWAMQSEMDAIVVNDDDAALRGGGRGSSSSSATVITDVDLLSLPELGWSREDACYLINLIEPVHAGHRRTIFWQGLKDAVIVKDMKVARTVREKFNREFKRQPPLIFTRDGYRWNRSGVLNGTNRLPSHLTFVFGEKEPTAIQEYQDIQKLFQDCEKVHTHLARLLWLDEEVRSTHAEELHSKINKARSMNLDV